MQKINYKSIENFYTVKSIHSSVCTEFKNKNEKLV